jgi:ATP-binding cassette subfamily B protein/subfamily B ATP-binding cassette protein MsbA
VGSVTGLALSSTPSLVNFCVFAVGAYWVITGHWSLGSLFAFQAYLGRVFGPAQSLASTGLQMQSIRASLERRAAGRGPLRRCGVPRGLLRLRPRKPRP